MISRQSRKSEHLKYARALADGPADPGFADAHLIHNCLPQVACSEIDLRTQFAGLQLAHPVIINAMTGGAADVAEVNSRLAQVARRTGSAIALGSQFAAIQDRSLADTYKIVRRIYPEGKIFANLGAYASPEHVRQAVEMVEADAVQIHLNAAQEMIMAEGDRDFSRWLEQIAAIVAAAEVPVIVKETGCGIAAEQARELLAVGVRAIDVGGAGGTNFIAIEAARSQSELSPEMLAWGIPTLVSAIETASALADSHAAFMVSGGIRSASDMIKVLALGADAVGIAGPILSQLDSGGVDGACVWLQEKLNDLKRLMVLLGVSQMQQLASVPMVITGFSREWLAARGIDTQTIARKRAVHSGHHPTRNK